MSSSSSDLFVDDLRESRDRALAEVERLKAEIGTLRAAVANQAEALERERRMGKTVVTSMKVTNNGIIGNEVGTIPMILYCPMCGHRHVDVGEFATKPHHTHACQNKNCGHVWRPAIVPTCGVAWLPGFRNPEALEKGGSTFPHDFNVQAIPRHAEWIIETQRKLLGQLIDRIPLASRLTKEFLVEAIESAIRRTAGSYKSPGSVLTLGIGSGLGVESLDDFIHHATSNAVQTILLHLATADERDERQLKERTERKQTSHLDKCSQCGEVVTECHTCEAKPKIDIMADGRCRCDAAAKCPLGKVGSEARCTAEELEAANIPVNRLQPCDHPPHRRGTSGGLRRNQEICMQCGSVVEKRR